MQDDGCYRDEPAGGADEPINGAIPSNDGSNNRSPGAHEHQRQSSDQPIKFDRKFRTTDIVIAASGALSALAAITSAGAAFYAASTIKGTSEQTDVAINRMADVANATGQEASAVGGQLNEMRSSENIMTNELGQMESQAKALKISADAAVRATQISADQTTALNGQLLAQEAILSNLFRPRIVASPVRVDSISVKNSNTSITFTYSIKNIGNIPALNLSTQTQINREVHGVSSNNAMSAYPSQDQACNLADKFGTLQTSDFLPNAESTTQWTISIPVKEVEFDFPDLKLNPQLPADTPVMRTINAVVIGCASYRSAVDGSLRHTKFLFNIIGDAPLHHQEALAFSGDTVISGKVLRLSVDGRIGNHAD